MKKLNHKNVIKLHEVINNPNEDKFYMSNLFLYKNSNRLCLSRSIN